MSRALLTNALLRKTLASARSLGKKGVESVIIGESRFTPASFSRYCKKTYICGDVKTSPDRFLELVEEVIKKESIDVFMPMDEDVLDVVVRHRERLSDLCKLALPPTYGYEITSDKGKAYRHAMSVGVDIPATIVPESRERLTELAKGLRYPLVIKPTRSSGGRGIETVYDSSTLVETYMGVHRNYPFPVVQEHVGSGDVYDVVLIYNENSQLRAHYVMKHVRKYPLNTGPSSVQQSVHMPELVETAKRFVDGLNWVGVADLEFIVSNETGEAKFIELNPRMWNSVQAAIFSEVDVPWLLYEIALRGDCNEVEDFRDGVLCRNLLPGDILHFLANPDRWKMNPPFWNTGPQKMLDDIAAWDDPMPVAGFALMCLRYLLDARMWKTLVRR